ncbi:hypothetical protein CRE_16604 [Caenorhabditis remanei]|uniref:Uncharacterized protein n=1 Tax=Caenorhabditis remanei TaxID=31234 RepID=E3MAN2_CAERE|nr:hypothetical protein CRE_16604 [Caenorhabditis remanei]
MSYKVLRNIDLTDERVVQVLQLLPDDIKISYTRIIKKYHLHFRKNISEIVIIMKFNTQPHSVKLMRTDVADAHKNTQFSCIIPVIHKTTESVVGVTDVNDIMLDTVNHFEILQTLFPAPINVVTVDTSLFDSGESFFQTQDYMNIISNCKILRIGKYVKDEFQKSETCKKSLEFDVFFNKMKATDEITVHNVYVQGNLHFNGTCKKLDIALERVSTKDILEHSVGKTKLCLKEFSLDDLNKLICEWLKKRCKGKNCREQKISTLMNVGVDFRREDGACATLFYSPSSHFTFALVFVNAKSIIQRLFSSESLEKANPYYLRLRTHFTQIQTVISDHESQNTPTTKDYSRKIVLLGHLMASVYYWEIYSENIRTNLEKINAVMTKTKKPRKRFGYMSLK